MRPPQRLSSEVTTCFRNDLAVPNVLVAAPGMSFATPRVPSSRPIDHRWDKSRGIVFQNVKQPITRDCTWSPSNGIVFSRTGSPREYATRNIGQSSSDAGNRLDGNPNASIANSGHKAIDLGSHWSTKDLDALKGQNAKLQSDLSQWQKKSRELEAALSSQKGILAVLESQLATARRETKQNLEILQKSRDSQEATLQHALKRSKHEHDAELVKQNEIHVEKLDKLRAEFQAGIERLQGELQQQTTKYEKAVGEEADPQYTQNQQIIQQLRDEARVAAQVELQTVHSNLKSRLENAEQSRQDLEERVAAANKTIESTRKYARDQEIRIAIRNKKVDQQLDKADYHTYRKPFDDVASAAYEFLRASNDAFTSVAKADSPISTLSTTVELQKDFMHQLRAFKGHAHTTRWLMRCLHLEVKPDVSQITALAFFTTAVNLFVEERLNVTAQIAGLTLRIRSATGRDKAVLLARIDELKRKLHFLALIVSVHEDLGMLRGLEAVLNESGSEKAVFAHTQGFIDRLQRITGPLYALRRELVRRDIRIGYTQDLATLNEDDANFRRQLDNYGQIVRKQYILAEALGRHKSETFSKHNNTIEALIRYKNRAVKAKFQSLMSSLVSVTDGPGPRRLGSSDSQQTARATRLIRRQKDYLEHELKRQESNKRELSENLFQMDQSLKDGIDAQIRELKEQLSGPSTQFKSQSSVAEHKPQPAGFENVKSKASVPKGTDSQTFVTGTASNSEKVAAASSSAQSQEKAYAFRRVQSTASNDSKKAATSPFAEQHRKNVFWRTPRREATLQTRSFHDDVRARGFVDPGAESILQLASPHFAQGDSYEEPETRTAQNPTSKSKVAPLSDIWLKSGNLLGKHATKSSEDGPKTEYGAIAMGDAAPTPKNPQHDGSALGFQISLPKPKDAAIKTEPPNPVTHWSHTLYKDSESRSVRVYYCQKYEKVEDVAKLFLDEAVLGFDLEWRPNIPLTKASIKNGVSLIQLAAEDKIGLFHLARFSGSSAAEHMPPNLRTILESPKIIKVGVNVVGDANRLRKLLDVDMQGLLELSHLYRIVKYSVADPKSVNFTLKSLAEQVQDIFRFPLKKDETRTSNWTLPLDGAQQSYAAADAYAGFRLFHSLDAERKLMKPAPPRPAFLELDQPLVLGNGEAVFRSRHRPSTTSTSTHKDKDDAPDSSAEPTETTQSPVNPKSPAAVRPESPSLALAEAWIEQWRAERAMQGPIRAAALRAYHMWHQQQLDFPQVAAYCRDPPLSNYTIGRYVSDAVKLYDLPCDQERLRKALLELNAK